MLPSASVAQGVPLQRGHAQTGQQQTDGTWRVVDYVSKALTAAEKNYDVYDKEFLAVIWALCEWWAYLIRVGEMIM